MINFKAGFKKNSGEKFNFKTECTEEFYFEGVSLIVKPEQVPGWCAGVTSTHQIKTFIFLTRNSLVPLFYD